ncbi:MAG: hypothetical protein WCH98_22560, partial [Verrucomicrobiota bacterium]
MLLWDSTEKNAWLVAILDGPGIVRKIPFSWSLGSWDAFEISEDSHGRVWLTAALPTVVRCDPEGGSAHIFDLTSLSDDPSKKNWNRVGFTEDLRGGQWLWTANLAENYAGLKWPVKVDGNSLSRLSDIPGFTGRRLQALQVRDKDSLWMLTRQDGIFTLDLQSLSATSVPQPAKNALDSLDGIFPFGAGRLVLDDGRAHPSVWQYEDGQWTRRFGGAHVPLSFGNRPVPASLILDAGAIFAAHNGILFVPKDKTKEARLIDWRSGWTMGGGEFLGLGGNRFAAVTLSGSPPRWAVADLSDYLAPRPQSDVLEYSPWRGWAVDAEERIFTLMEEKAIALSIWENGAWRKSPLPPALKNDCLSHVKLDSRSRVWVFSEDINYPVGILSADLSTWEVQPDFSSALVAHCADLDGFAKDLSWLRPITGPNGRVVFRTENWEIKSWNGQFWKTWKLQDIGSFANGDRVSMPFFDGAGHLCVNTLRSDKTWVLGDDGKWTGCARQPGIPDKWTSNTPSHVDCHLPDDFRPQNIQNPWVATDNSGVTWVGGNNNLYKHYKGHTVAMFDGKAVHPFLKNPWIESVRADRFG